MKYIIIVPDGMADYPVKKLGNKTPLQAAKKPNMDLLAKNGIVGLAKMVPGKMVPGTDVANLSILGYSPEKYFTGRGPLEAANLGIKLGKRDIAFRCNLVTVKNNKLIDYSAGHITTEESGVLLKELNRKLGDNFLFFYTGVGYRHIMVKRGCSKPELRNIKKIMCYPPHDVMGKPMPKILPRGAGAQFLSGLMEKSRQILDQHPINKKRIRAGKDPGNMIWLWGAGQKPNMPSFFDKYSLKASVVSAVDIIQGIGRILGMKVVKVPGATGYFDTNYEGKALYALRELKKNDLVFMHVESMDEAGHLGDAGIKAGCIEDFDKRLLGVLLNGIKKYKDYKILLLPDHFTPVSLKTHTRGAVPFLIYKSNGSGHMGKTMISGFDENTASKSGLRFNEGRKLIRFFLGS